jgi:amino acid transporter
MPPALERALGPREALSLVVGRIIGSGIFRTPGPIMALVLAPGPFFAVWLIAGAMTMLSALCYAELVAMLPRSGGPYAYLKEAYPPWWAFLRGWAMFFVSETASIAAVALVFAQYSAVMWTASGGAAWPRGLETSLAIAGVWLFTWVNARGVQAGGRVQNVLTVLKLGGLVAVAGAGLLLARNAGLDGVAAAPPPVGFWATVAAIGAALRYAFFAFSGWEGATYVAEEVREPERNLPRSILWGIGVVLGIYLLVNLAYLRQLGPAGMAGSKQVAADAMRAALGAGGAILIAAAVVLSTAGNINAQVMVKARTWHAMARDGLFPSALGRVDARRHTRVGGTGPVGDGAAGGRGPGRSRLRDGDRLLRVHLGALQPLDVRRGVGAAASPAACCPPVPRARLAGDAHRRARDPGRLHGGHAGDRPAALAARARAHRFGAAVVPVAAPA